MIRDRNKMHCIIYYDIGQISQRITIYNAVHEHFLYTV